MKEFEKIKDMLLDEVLKISNDGQLSMDALCVLDKIFDLWKDIDTVEMYEENDVQAFLEDFSRDNGYSGRSNLMRRYYDGNSYMDGGSYNDGNSYRGGSSYRRGGGYSRDDGTKQKMIQKLEMLWNDSRDEHDRNSIKKVLDELKQFN